MNADFFEILKRLKERCKLFNDFSDEELKSFLHLAKIEKYDIDNQAVFYQGDEGESMYLILSGKVEIFYLSNFKGQTLINTLTPGDIFGEMSLITKEKRSANVKILDPPVLLLTISEKVLEGDYKIQAKIFKNFARILAGRLKNKNKEASILKKMQESKLKGLIKKSI